MFYYLKGTVEHIENGLCVLDVGGVGFLVNVSLNTLARLEKGRETKLYTYCAIREDAFDIYGFYEYAEKRAFELLIGVSGVGPRMAQSVLSSVTPEGLSMAIFSENEKALTAASGVGKRIAQRIILELKDKISKEAAGMPTVTGSGVVHAPAQISDKTALAVAALVEYGYSHDEAVNAIKSLDTDSMSVGDIVTAVFKNSLR